MTQPAHTIRDRKIKLALIGCGRISERHLKSIEAHRDNIDLVAVCDSDTAKLTEVAGNLGVEGFSDMTELLHSSDADVVTLCTPSGLHPLQTIAAAQAGKHIISEKPMATRWDDGKKMVEACDEQGVRLFVVKQNRFNATLQLLNEAVAKKRFGRISNVTLNVFWTRPQDYYDQAGWRGTWEFDGGALMNQASHYIDLLDWIVGPIESVFAYTGTIGRNIEVEDTGVVAVKWRNGALGTVNVTMLTYPKNYEGSITILGDKGTARVGGVAVNEIQTWDFEDDDPMDEYIGDASYKTASVYGFGHDAYYDNVVKTLRGEAEPYTCGREGLRSLEILAAAYKSARDGVKVSLPLD